MKKTILALVSVVAAVGAMAQGSVNFANRVTAVGLSAPVTDAMTGTPLAGDAYLATLYWGTSADSLAPVTAIVGGVDTPLAQKFATAGFFVGGKTLIKGAAEGAAIFVQVRAWEKSAGATYEAAEAALGKVGKSNTFQVTLGGDNLSPPQTPANMVGLTSFTIAAIPEPSVLALGALGAFALILRRKN
jgi:hypothetical protein